jgi:hypothetical protein
MVTLIKLKYNAPRSTITTFFEYSAGIILPI